MIELTELYNTSDMDRLKRELARLVKALDYKSINTLLRRNQNTWLFDTRELNEEIPCKERHFVKRKGVLKYARITRKSRLAISTTIIQSSTMSQQLHNQCLTRALEVKAFIINLFLTFPLWLSNVQLLLGA